MRRLVVGLDGCAAGWVMAALDIGPPNGISFSVLPDATQLLGALESGEVAAAGVDMPIGLPEAGPRRCDVEARRLLGPRRSSVFPAPCRPLLALDTYAEANARSKAMFGKGISRQAFGIVAKVRQMDELVTPDLQRRLVEVHPEVSFAVAAGRPMQHHKATPPGREERLDVLASVVPGIRPATVGRLTGSQPDDVLDAAIVAWTAARLLDGVAHRLGGDLDGRGLRMEILS